MQLPTILKPSLVMWLILILNACGRSSTEVNNPEKKLEKTDAASITDTLTATDQMHSEDSSNLDNATYFVVVADTGRDYYTLHRKMLELNRQYHIPIDTMKRYYNTTKNLIALRDDDEDEVYAGEYFPRRFPSANLSLEYLNFYKDEAGEKTIALITGIYEQEKSADSALAVLHKTVPAAHKIKADIYIGCVH